MSQTTNVTNAFSGLVPNNFPTNARAIIDNNYVQTVSVNSGAGVAVTNYIDLGDLLSGVPYVTTETINVELAISASNNGNTTNAAVAYATLQQTSANTDRTANTANNVTVPTTGQVNFAGVGTSLPASSYVFKLPPGCGRFIKAKITNNSGNDLSDSTMTLRLLF